MSKQVKLNQKGFTIIEVLIVLAIAGLIMLIVFLAIPSLQRSQRNSARDTEASRISAAVTECLSNKNGSTHSENGCGNPDNIQVGDLQRLESFAVQTTGDDDFGGEGAGSATTTRAIIRFNRQCTPEGDGSEPTNTGSRSFVVLYQKENDINRCLSS